MSRCLICLMLFCTMFTLGCKGTGFKKDDAAFRQQVLNGAKVAWVPLEAEHDGNTGLQSGTSSFGLIGALIRVGVEADNRKKNDLATLDVQVLDAISGEIKSELALVPLQIDKELFTSLLKDKPKTSKVVEFADQNNAQAVLKVWVNYTHNGQWKTNLSMHGYWTLYDAQGKKRVEITTLLDSPEQVSSQPNTYKEKYQSQYIELARRSAAEFLRLMRGEEPSPEAVVSR